jgi:tetratricopeptide (TPR) repeat protein
MHHASPRFRCRALVLAIAGLITIGAASAQDIKSCTQADAKATLAACTAALSSGGQEEVQLAFTLYERAAALSELKQCATAVVDLTSALELHQSFAAALKLRGDCRVRIGEFDGAIADYTEALSREPTMRWVYSSRATAWTAKGESLRTLKDMAEAIDQARRATGDTASYARKLVTA